MKKFYLSFLFFLALLPLQAATLTENFEAAGFIKTTYDVLPAGNAAEDSIRLTSGSWRSYEGIRGASSGSDRFNGLQSVRMRGNGTGAVRAVLEMNFNKLSGAGVVQVYAARYGTDGLTYFHFEASADGGGTWPYVSSTFTISTTTLTAFSWTPNITGSVRVRIIKETNNSRCSFDDFSITDYTAGLSSEIQLQQPAGTDSACGFTYHYGTQNTGTNTDMTVRITNTGTGALAIASTPITGTNAGEFSVLTAPAASVAAGSYTDMVIRFSPLAAGSKTADITLNTDDADESACVIHLTGSAVNVPCTALIISEYGDPVTGSGKYIELYNGTASAVNLADYQLWKVNNGGTWPENTLTLSGTLAANTAYVVANNAADVPGADLYDATFCGWNGNDALGLARKTGAIFLLTDVVGTDGADPGTGWSVAGIANATNDKTLVRKTSVTVPNSDWTSSAGTNSVNSEWFVRPYQLSNTGCNISSCLSYSTVGFFTTGSLVNESVTTVTVQVTMNIAPAADVTVTVSDALLGTAGSGSDYLAFTPATLTYTTAEAYPSTKSVSINILDDAVSESNENIVLSVDAGCGALIGNGTYTLTIIDDELPEGIIINEFSQGSASKEYLELVVTGTPGTTIDLRGWIIDDNSGIFSAGYGTLMGIADGHLKFSDVCSWEKVPVGSIILLYNSSDKNTGITMADDPTDANLDYLYVIGIEVAASTCASSTVINPYFSADCVKPNNTSYDIYTPAVYTNPDWNAMQFRNSGDAVQVRSSNGGFFHGLSYGTKGSGSDCSTCALNQINHPDYPVYDADALYFSGTGNVTYAYYNINDNDFRKRSNWTSTTATSPNALESPGVPNNTNNQNWITSLRTPFDVVTDDQSYTCDLRAYESRYYLDAQDDIIFWIKNNTATDHGPLTAQTILHDDATTGLGFQNTLLTGLPLFMQKTFAATPSTASPAGYKIVFYVSTQELQDYCDYINPILNAIPGNYMLHNHTPDEITGHLKIYKTATTNRAWTVTSDGQVEIVTPVVGTYGAYTTFEYDGFTGFSGYALGDVVTPFIGLPVELTAFNADCDNDRVTLHWTTASEMNSDYFVVERASDAIRFTPLATLAAAGQSSREIQYSFVDDYPLNGTNYYRLKQQDIGAADGVYSNIIQTACETAAEQLQFSYQPATGVQVVLNAATAKDILFTIYEISGKLLYSENKTLEQGTTSFSLGFRQTLAKGIYVIRAMDGETIYSQKILVH